MRAGDGSEVDVVAPAMQVLPSSLATFPGRRRSWFGVSRVVSLRADAARPEERLMLTFACTVSKGELWLPCQRCLTRPVHLLLD